MGAGCYHKNIKGEKAAWIDFPNDEIEENNTYITEEDITDIVKGIGYYHNNDLNFYNGLFDLKFEYKYYCDGLIIQLSPRYEEYSGYYGKKNPLYYLAMANFDKAERKIWKTLQSNGYTLNVATSGYTCVELTKI